MKKTAIILLILLVSVSILNASDDWPIYKGNIYFTGNNDEITVKNNNLKWLYQATEAVLNPIASDGMIFFLDLSKNVYCLDEESGKLRWKIDLHELAGQFRGSTKSFGKSKYPLIKGDKLLITDNIAIYALNKYTGKVIWARTGMRSDDLNLKTPDNKYIKLKDRTDPVKGSGNWTPEKSTYAMVDSIYSDPVIVGETIYYGTRNEFISRNINNGHMNWNNDEIKSWSKFPSFYDEFLFTQSMDYKTNTYTLFCLKAASGEKVWSRDIKNPHRIYPPVVYKQRVYFISGMDVYCIDLKNGEIIWSKQYNSLITSNPGFTERAILFTMDNGSIVMINPDNGEIQNRLEFGENKAPYFVIIRDQIYVGTTFKKNIGGRELSWSKLEAYNIMDKSMSWEYSPQFPGASYQPVASNGIMFLPAGNYLYAIGTDYYPKIVDGGSGYYDPYNRIPENEEIKKDDVDKLKRINEESTPKKDKPEAIPMKKLNITINSNDGTPLKGTVDIKKWDKGKVIYHSKVPVSKPDQIIDVPDMDDVEITAEADGHLPEKEIISRDDKDKKITLTKIEKGKGIIVNNIHFETGKAHLRKESLNILNGIIDQMNKNKAIKLEVRGHTDSSGGTAYNKKLSERRADSVTEYMIKQGISPERLQAMGMGEEKPVADNKTAEGRRKNRRTEFYVIEK
jgi:outer membrane protein OmpA-like peptidoglycan-associated protein/outer membrane protein assembly factor BamB